MPRRIFIGDVHGHYDGLMQLLEMIDPAQEDQLYFAGDLIDRGVQSAQVVEYVRSHGYGCVLGNHEQLLLEAFGEGRVNAKALRAWLYSGGQSTLSSYASLDLLNEHLAWLQALPLYLDLGDVWLVHAGLDPRLNLNAQTADELCWIRDEFHNNPDPYFTDKLIITGHTITFTFPETAPGQLVSGPGWLNIDTGAYHPRSGWLTGLDLDNHQVYQVNVHDQIQRQRPLQEATSPLVGQRQRSLVALSA
ncbi:MAG: serine/threonine protein phosphatase [Leptolyngbya sp. RL_3_1]|nr:serine/threonine protein phosphatase [Leptolyngbya sp. RL_3_1]